LLGLLVLCGIYVIFSFDFQYKAGLMLGIAAGFTCALFSIFNAKMVRRIPAFTITFYEMIGVTIGLLLFLPVYKMTWAEGHQLRMTPAPMDWLYLSILALVCSVYAYSVAVHLMKKISVFMLQLTLNLEPVYGIIMAVIIFGEREKMGWNFYAGTAVILAAVLLYPLLKKKYEIPT
ncbi:MAG TPA: DMT family transporter, partial [Ohtaekwangia sp.]|nr:DMT family transporter [Ohtaekwangia sp.]